MNTHVHTLPSSNSIVAGHRRRIVINGRFLTQNITGVQRYALELTRALDDLLGNGEIDASQYAVEIIAPRGANNPQFKNIVFTQAGNLKGHLWEQFELPRLSWGAFLINLCNTAPILKWNKAVTIHDTAVWAVPQAYSFPYRAWYRFLLPCITRSAKQIFTVSQFSKQELMRCLSVKEKKCLVVKEGREHIEEVQSDDDILDRHHLLDKPFVLAVSSLSPNKNFGAIIDALQWLNGASFNLVIAGGTNPRIFARDQKPLPDFVKHVGYVSDGELKSLYEHASCFIYPSLYEGFGLPPLEAMTCGCPVISSERASLPEVCGDAALYCDPTDPKSLATQIAKIMAQPALRNELSRRGRERAQMFSWKQCAQEVWKEVVL